MFNSLNAPAPPRILQLAQEFNLDQRPGKIDLGIGVYKDEHGQTAILNVVKEAERRLHAEQQTKAYLGLQGDELFCELSARLVLGEDVDLHRLATVQTPGGSGALRMLFDLIKYAAPNANIWLPTPTWANHAPTIQQVGLSIKSYRYYDMMSQSVDFDGMFDDLSDVSAGDVVLFHGCCHNPTGADLTPDQWDKLGNLALQNGFTPLIDIAYIGFADGLDEDSYGVRRMADTLPNLLVSISFSKNFAIYRERAGLAVVKTDTDHSTRSVFGAMKNLARSNYSMPPDHGAGIVRTVLNDKGLKTQWIGELNEMRNRIVDMRLQLSDALRQSTNSDRFDFIATQKGMFSMLGIDLSMVEKLRKTHGIYIVDDGRINVAALQSEKITRLAQTMARAL